MKIRIPLIAIAVCAAASALSASRASAQHPATIDSSANRTAVIPADSAATRARSDFEASLAQLASSLQAMAQRIANDPQLKVAAVKLASSLVATAQQVVTENRVTIEDALKIAADRIAAAQRALPPAQSPPPPKPPASR